MWENCHDKEYEDDMKCHIKREYMEDLTQYLPQYSISHDLINHPPHYTQTKFEVIDVLEEWFPTDPLLFSVGKYIARAKYKGNELQDLRKAKWFLERKIAKLEAQECQQKEQTSPSLNLGL